MAKELRLEGSLPVPSDPFEQAAILVQLQPLFDQFREGIMKLGGTVTHELVTPRAAKGE